MPLGGKGPVTIVVLCTEAFVAGVFLGARYYVRQFVKGNAGSDDYTLLAAWVLMTAFALIFTVSSLYGFGQHVSDLQLADIMMATKIELFGQAVVSVAMGLSKTGVALFLMRIVTIRWQKMVLWGWIFCMMFLSILLAVSVFAQCYPVQGLWDPSVTIEACPINLTIVAYVMCAFSAVMDFFLALCPWYVLKDLNMKPKEKWTIIISLSLGIFAGICGSIRTAGLGVLSETKDYLFATADSVMWTSSELTTTLICVSVPVLRPLVKKLTTTLSSNNTSYVKQSGGGQPANSIVTFGRLGNKNKALNLNPEEGYQMGNVSKANAATPTISEEDGMETVWRDNNSDKSILEKGQGIQLRHDVSVTYDRRS